MAASGGGDQSSTLGRRPGDERETTREKDESGCEESAPIPSPSPCRKAEGSGAGGREFGVGVVLNPGSGEKASESGLLVHPARPTFHPDCSSGCSSPFPLSWPSPSHRHRSPGLFRNSPLAPLRPALFPHPPLWSAFHTRVRGIFSKTRNTISEKIFAHQCS